MLTFSKSRSIRAEVARKVAIFPMKLATFQDFSDFTEGIRLR